MGDGKGGDFRSKLSEVLTGKPSLRAPICEDRVVLVFSTFDQTRLFTPDLCRTIGDCDEFGKTWLLEALVPIPVATLSVQKISDAKPWEALLALVANQKQRIRVVAATGPVDFGGFGTKYRAHFGSVGQLMSDALSACFSLPIANSWMDEATCILMGYDTEVTQEAVGRKFVKFTRE